MPRVSREQAEKNRETIEKVSSELIRERGLSVSVADMMAAAGLTPGGFYGHFSSKDELTGIACSRAFAQASDRWEKRMAAGSTARSARDLLIDGYLSSRNRLEAVACPLVSLAVDISREEPAKPVRDEFAKGVAKLVALLESVQDAELDDTQKHAAALSDISTMVGALVLARATKGKPISNELIEAARDALHRT